MGSIISIVNEKGGVGKTTCTYNIGTALALQGYRVLMIDLDYQCSLTVSCGYEPDAEGEGVFGGRSILDFFEKDGAENLKDSFFTIDSIETFCEEHPGMNDITPNIYIAPGTIRMAEMENRMMLDRKLRTRFISNLKLLKDFFHFVLIDCPPALNLPMTAALIASDGVVIPLKPEPLDYYGLRALERTIDTVRETLNPDLAIVGTILNLYRAVVKAHEAYLIKMGNDPEKPLLGTVKETAIVTKGIDIGLPVVLNSPSSQPAVEFVNIAKHISEWRGEQEGSDAENNA